MARALDQKVAPQTLRRLMDSIVWNRGKVDYCVNNVALPYSANRPIKAYVEPTSIGCELVEMPLFLKPSHDISVPLEATCRNAWAEFPNAGVR